METTEGSFHRVWNKLGALSMNLEVLDEYRDTIGPLIEGSGLREDFEAIVRESLACVEALKADIALLDRGLPKGK